MDVDVAIVGFGPVGALLANLLAEHGVRTAVMERDREVYRLPRAVHFDHEVMRVFQSIGLAEAAMTNTAPIRGYEFLNGDGELLFHFDIKQDVTSQGWKPDYMFHQPSLEACLRDAAAKRDEVDVYLEHEVFSLEERESHVAVEIRDRASGELRELRATYVVGCDGANSFVRKHLGLELDDFDFDEPWLVVDATTDVPAEARGLPTACTQRCDPARPVTFIPVAGPYIRWEFMLRPGEDPRVMQEPETIDALIGDWIDPGRVEVIRAAVYDFHALVAQRWNTRRVFLAGDAAHQMPPFLGQGMCSGMRDAANLGWKLAMVLGGRAQADLLQTYQVERDPHVRRIVQTAIDMGRIICTLDPEAARARDAQWLSRPERTLDVPEQPGLAAGLVLAGAPLAGVLGLQARVRDQHGKVARLDDVTGAGFTLLVRAGSDAGLRPEAQAVFEQIQGIRFEIGDPVDVDGAYARWFDACACDAVLVRPDHHVFGAAPGVAAASDLLEALGQQLRAKDPGD